MAPTITPAKRTCILGNQSTWFPKMHTSTAGSSIRRMRGMFAITLETMTSV